MWILCHHRCHLLLHKSYIDVHCKHLTIISKLHPDKELEDHCLTLCLACCCCPQEVKDDTDLATCRTNTMTLIDCLGLKNKTYFSLAHRCVSFNDGHQGDSAMCSAFIASTNTATVPLAVCRDWSEILLLRSDDRQIHISFSRSAAPVRIFCSHQGRWAKARRWGPVMTPSFVPD